MADCVPYKSRSRTRILLAAASLLALGALAITPALAQHDAGPSLPPIPDMNQAEVDALIRDAGFTESKQTVKELVPGWNKPKMMLVHVDRPDRIAWLQKAVPDVKLVGVYQTGTIEERQAEALPYAAEADAFVSVLPNVLCDETVVRAATNLKWLHSFGAGVNDCIGVSPTVASGKFLLTNSQKIRSRPLAEDVFAMMVALMRGIDLEARMDAGKRLVPPEWGERGMQMQGRTVLVVGLGGIGTEFAKMAHGIGMKVIATRASSREGPDFVDYVGLADELPGLIGKADVVAMCAPLTSDTRGMFDTAMFNRMKRGAVFVNISREDVAPKQDLLDALVSGQLGAAAMYANVGVPGERMPLTPDDPLWSAPNLLYTTHVMAPMRAVDEDTDGFWQRTWILTREVMRRYASGDKMIAVVDVRRGY
ncbi:MAG TPA: NAD(P)-dependent oxidoreductase [Woeseiaceae bacterium]|nr:NAD(P)-dependent oxidoreductase [Woeseiaceae bacterium]